MPRLQWQKAKLQPLKSARNQWLKEEEVEETLVQKRLAHMDEADEICYYPASQIYHKLGCPYPEHDLNKCKVKIMKPCKYCFPQQKPKRG